MKRTILIVSALALVASACGGGEGGAAADPPATTTTAATPTTQAPGDPDALVLEVKRQGGFVPVEFAYNPGPSFVLYADGTLLSEGPVPEIFPAPLVVPFQRVQLTAEQVRTVLDAIETAGLPDVGDERLSAADNVADAADTVFLYDDGIRHRMSVYALGISDPDDDAVVPYMDLVDLLTTLSFSDDPATVEPDRYQVIVTGSFGGEDDEMATIAPWPLRTAAADLPQTGFADLRCVELSGADAAEASASFTAANQMTFFEDAGETYRFLVRPLAPHEDACPS